MLPGQFVDIDGWLWWLAEGTSARMHVAASAVDHGRNPIEPMEICTAPTTYIRFSTKKIEALGENQFSFPCRDLDPKRESHPSN